MIRAIVLALILVAASPLGIRHTDALPLTFPGPDAVSFFGGTWFPDVSPPLAGPNPDRTLTVGITTGPFFFPDLAVVPLHTAWTFDQQPPVVTDRLVPEFGLSKELAQLLGPEFFYFFSLQFQVPDSVTDFGPHRLTFDVSLPEESRHYEFEVMQPVPEPSTLLLLGTSLAGFGAWVWRRGLGRALQRHPRLLDRDSFSRIACPQR